MIKSGFRSYILKMINHFPAFHDILFSLHLYLFLTHVPGLINAPSPLLHFNPGPVFHSPANSDRQ